VRPSRANLPIRAATPTLERRMDKLDRRILALYQHDTRRIAGSIGAEVGLSEAAVQRRLKSLRATGAIAAEIAQLNPTILGVRITCIVTVSMAATAAPHMQLDRFKRDIAAAPEVQQCYHVTGPIDFVLVVTVPAMEDYAAFARHWFEANKAVARFDTHVVLDRVKVGVSLPVATE
jgi:Lrp/AsnC family transcriptional regulator, leucine-responsive regulatory protein